MTFEEYLMEYYGFNTSDRKWRGMGIPGKALLRDSYKMDMAELKAKESPKTVPEIATTNQEKGKDIAALP